MALTGSSTVTGSISGTLSGGSSLSGALSGSAKLSGALSIPQTITKNTVLFATTEEWNAQTLLIASEGVFYVYSDHGTDADGNDVPGVKIGDGTSYLIDMPFVGDDIAATLAAHIADTVVHITADEREAWNGKLTADIDGENLIFSAE